MTTATPRLSIGLPVYNGERYLGEALEALLGQTFEDFELIVSDNASTDETARICCSYQKRDRRIRYFRQPKNIGLAPNHNFVLGQARGELYKSAHHDDLCARDLLQRCVDALEGRDVQLESIGNPLDARLRPHKDGRDDLRLRRIDGTFERARVAGMRHGHRHRRQRPAC